MTMDKTKKKFLKIYQLLKSAKWLRIFLSKLVMALD